MQIGLITLIFCFISSRIIASPTTQNIRTKVARELIKVKREIDESKIDEFQLVHAYLSDDQGTAVTKIFSLGQREDDDFLGKYQIDGLKFDPFNVKHWTTTVVEQYPNPSFGRNDLRITYVEVTVTQTSTHSHIDLLEGGYLNETIRFQIKGEQTLRFDYMISIYVKFRSDDWLNNIIDIRNG